MTQHATIQAKISHLVSQVFQKLHFQRLLPSVTAGILIGFLVIFVEISFAALIFSGELSGYVSEGIGFLLFGAFVIGLVVALTSSFPGMIALPQDSPVAILALMASAIASSMPVSAMPENVLATVIAAIIMTSLLTGVFFWVLGTWKLGSLIRFIPYPVVGGFLAGTGWLLVKGALGVMTDISISRSTVPALFQFDILLKWLPGMFFGVLLLIILRRYSHFLIMPAMIVASIGLFYLVLALTGTSLTQAGAQGWLLGPFPKGGLWQPSIFLALPHANWAMIVEQLGSIGTILMISVISLLLNAGGLELAVRRDIDLNSELRSAGLANFFAGLGGSPPGYHALSLSALGHKLGAQSRLAGMISALLCGITFFFGASLLSFFPKFVLGGLLFFLGLAFLTEWVYDAWFTLPTLDYILVLVILGIVGTIGFLQGVVVGIFLAVVLFVVNYSRIDVIKHRLSGTTYQSHVERAVPYQRVLQQNGNQLLILKLQGFLFFGTAHNLLTQIRQRIATRDLPPLRFAVFDFQLVSGLDSSALQSFRKIKQLAEAHTIILVFTHLSPQIHRQFVAGKYIEQDDPMIRIFPDLDHGVEWCEERILTGEEIREKSGQKQGEQAFLESVFDDLMQFLDQQEAFETIVAEMMPYFERQESEKGCYLIRQGDPPEALYFIESALATVQLEHEDGKMTRLRTLSFGTVVGELGFYLRQRASASVLVQEPGTIYRLSFSALQRMTENDPKIAATFHEFMAHLLGERLANTNGTLQALLD